MKGILFSIVSLCFIVLLSISYFTKFRIKFIRNRLYRYLLIVNLFMLVSEIVSTPWILYGSYNVIPYIILRLHWFSGTIWFSLLFFYCVVFISETKENRLIDIIKKNAKFKVVSVIMIICFIAFFFIPFSKIEANDNFSYLPGPAAIYVYAVSTLYVAFLAIYSIKNRKTAKTRTKASIISITIEMVMAAILQPFFTKISISAFAIALQLFFLYFNIENPDLELIKELETARNEIDKSSRAKTDFLSNMSHEIRSPMNAIIGFSQAIVDNNYDDSSIREDIFNINQAGNNLLDIINNILDISKIETGQEVLELKEYYLDSIINELQKITESRIDNKPIEFINKVDENVPAKLYGDSVKLYQVLLNILTNSVKYTEVGKITFELKYEMKNDNEVLLHFRISDTGYGIKKEDFDKLFEKFSRLDVAVDKEIEGTGLGLLITKKYVDLMGGKIWFDSQYLVGTNFYIDLTQKIVDNTPIKDNKDNLISSNTFVDIDCSNYKVLLVDDNKLNIKVAHKILSKYKFQIEEVYSGKECVDKVKGWNKYDMIFLDHIMPEMDGIEVLHILKSLKDYDIPPIVALTANALSGMRETYLKEGFDEYLSKPININELNKIVIKYFKDNK